MSVIMAEKYLFNSLTIDIKTGSSVCVCVCVINQTTVSSKAFLAAAVI